MKVEPINQLVTLTDSGLSSASDGLLVVADHEQYPPLGSVTPAAPVAWQSEGGIRVGLRIARLGRSVHPAPLVLRVYTGTSGPRYEDPVAEYSGPLVSAPAGLLNDVTLHWGDGYIESALDLSAQPYIEHTYAEPGTYRYGLQLTPAGGGVAWDYPFAWQDVVIE